MYTITNISNYLLSSTLLQLGADSKADGPGGDANKSENIPKVCRANTILYYTILWVLKLRLL